MKNTYFFINNVQASQEFKSNKERLIHTGKVVSFKFFILYAEVKTVIKIKLNRSEV